ncbi:hypothetical protein Tco_0280763 [Tanacetum coccineum]
MDDILAFLIPISKGRSVVSIIARVVFAAMAYFLWKERNSRLFSKKILSIDNLVESICSTVRLKLVTFKFKISSTSRMLLDLWKVPKKCIDHDGSAGRVLAWFQEFFLLEFANLVFMSSYCFVIDS